MDFVADTDTHALPLSRQVIVIICHYHACRLQRNFPDLIYFYYLTQDHLIRKSATSG